MALSDDMLAQLVDQLKQDPGLVESLPNKEGNLVRAAIEGADIHQLAQMHRMSEQAVWGVLRNAARAATGQSISPVESGGFGSDTDPGVTGGYGETGFGSLGNEPPEPISEEPRNL
jgi:hypothetical protein